MMYDIECDCEEPDPIKGGTSCANCGKAIIRDEDPPEGYGVVE